MSVHKISGPVRIQQVPESLKALMRQILAIEKALSRRVGQQDVDSPVPLQRKPKLPDPAVHLRLGILVDSRLIPHGTSQTEDPYTLVDIDGIFHTDTPLRRRLVIAVVVISMDIENRTFHKSSEKGKVLGSQIPAGQNQIHPV